MSGEEKTLLVLRREHFERRLDDTTTQAEDEVKSGLLLNIVVRESTAILQLLSRKD
jgi:hypothetical protein